MFINLETFNNKEIRYLGKWRAYTLFLAVDKTDGQVIFFTSLGKDKTIIKNKEVITILVDTCRDLIAQSLLSFASSFNDISYMGRLDDKDYWALGKKNDFSCPSLPTFASFDGFKFSLIEDNNELKQLIKSFSNFKYNSDLFMPTGLF